MMNQRVRASVYTVCMHVCMYVCVCVYMCLPMLAHVEARG